MNLSSQSANGSASIVLSIDCLKGSSKEDEWASDLPHTGDIVEEISIGNMTVKSNFNNGEAGVQKILRYSYRQKETSINIRVRRGSDEFADMQGYIVAMNQFGWKKQYVMRAVKDPNYVVTFLDRTERDCLRLQGSRISKMKEALEGKPLQDVYHSYPWEERVRDMQSIPSSTTFYTILFLPKSSDKSLLRYTHIDDTIARAVAWLNATQATGAPVLFTNMQTESLIIKMSGETASSTVNVGSLSELSNVASMSLYGFEDFHGVDIGMARAVRLWFCPEAVEARIEIEIRDTDRKLGFSMNRTREGFIYITNVEGDDDDDNVPSARSGINSLYRQALRASRLLVVSRISNQKVLPWMVSSTGAIRCFDTISLSRKLSLHRHAKVPIVMHVFLWDKSSNFASTDGISMHPETLLGRCRHENQPIPSEVGREDSNDDITLENDGTEANFSSESHDSASQNNRL